MSLTRVMGNYGVVERGLCTGMAIVRKRSSNRKYDHA